MTSAEVVLWQMLKGKQVEGLKFRCQFGVGPFIIDFYCPSLRLAIELDGEYHFSEEMDTYDEQRSLYLKENNIKVLRFENRIVFEDPLRILEAIQDVMKERDSINPSPLTGSSPKTGELFLMLLDSTLERCLNYLIAPLF